MLSEVDNETLLVQIESEGFRLIPSRFPPVSIYERIIANDRLEELVEIENLTNPRLRKARLLTDGVVPVDPDSPVLQNWNLAPFTYAQPQGTRFFRPIHCCLELASDLQTALAISVAKRAWFLEQTSEPSQGIDMRVLKTPINGRFLDLQHVPVDTPLEERWSIGDQAIEAGYDGVLFTCPERPSATCLAVLKEAVLGRSQQTKHYRFKWNGSQIISLYAFDDATIIDPDVLCGEELSIAA